jgi:hypothetical protein
MTTTGIDPQTHDTKLAALYFDLARMQQQAKVLQNRIVHSAGVVTRLWGAETKRGWGSEDQYHSFDEAVVILSQREDRDSSIELAEYEQTTAIIEATEEAIEIAESEYTGWSRFFLVTSSQGHIHSSLRCSSCRQSTTYGWLPELSGKTEAETVKIHGPALCTVCFPSAPVEDTGYKITASRAQELAWSPDREEKIADRARREEEKTAKKAKKAANALKLAETMGHKMNALVDQFGENTDMAYRWTWDHKGYDNAYFAYSEMIERRTR